MDEAPEGEVRALKLLRLLVTVLTAVMIVGFIVLIGFLVTRFPGQVAAPLPETVRLPDGTIPVAVTHGPGWYAVVTGDSEILVFSAATGELLQSVPIEIGE